MGKKEKKIRVNCLVCDGKMERIDDVWKCKDCNYAHYISKEKNFEVSKNE